MPPKPKYSPLKNHKWQDDQRQWSQSKESNSHTDSNQKLAGNLPKSEPNPGIVKTLINFFEDV
jgi:hypothetical protein